MEIELVVCCSHSAEFIVKMAGYLFAINFQSNNDNFQFYWIESYKV